MVTKKGSKTNSSGSPSPVFSPASKSKVLYHRPPSRKSAPSPSSPSSLSSPVKMTRIYVDEVDLPDETRETKTEREQRETFASIIPFLNQDFWPSGSTLQTEIHQRFIFDWFDKDKLPAGFTAFDASRPWISYWSLTAAALLRSEDDFLDDSISGPFLDVDEDGHVIPSSDPLGAKRELKDRIIDTLSAAASPDGGYGGGHGQLPHLATTYAAVLSLLSLKDERAMASIDRTATWHFLGRLKEADGSFRMAEGGEIDARGPYCAMVVHSLLNLDLDLPGDAPARKAGLKTFSDKLVDWIRRCQTYEGGLGAVPFAEAHGAYTYVGLATLCLLKDPCTALYRYLDVPALVSWLAQRQCTGEGGFNGRTNKLVDACYSHWIGSCYPLVEQALAGMQTTGTKETATPELYDRQALIKYIKCCCQDSDGGLRDKPSKAPDGYHTCYALVGLANAQCQHVFDFRSRENIRSGFMWSATKRDDAEDRSLNAVHPLFVIPYDAVEFAARYFSKR